MKIRGKKWKTGFLWYLKYFSSDCLLSVLLSNNFIFLLLFIFMYLMFELCDLIFQLEMCVECVVPGMLFTMQIKIEATFRAATLRGIWNIYFGCNILHWIRCNYDYLDHKNGFVCTRSSGGHQWKCNQVHQTCSLHHRQ